MCPRRISGGIVNPLINIQEIDLPTFQQWFPESFLRQLDSIFMCGNLGDPIIAKDCAKICKYIRKINESIQLRIHTNGSARSSNFWKDLAKSKVNVTFGIDGLNDTHALYRIGTDFDKIMGNSKEFIDAGGVAEWHMLVFKHNEHQVDACRSLSNDLGFSTFQAKHTSRFTESSWPVINDTGKTTHVLIPTDLSKSLSEKVKALSPQSTEIRCKALHNKEFYIAADGTISPCCWLDFSWVLPNQIRRINYMDNVGIFPNLNKSSLNEIFSSNYFQTIEDTWAIKPLSECSRQCGKFDKLREQFVN
jgi:sulfatase maturation enzyme AslB (radical SAM superfamily)